MSKALQGDGKLPALKAPRIYLRAACILPMGYEPVQTGRAHHWSTLDNAASAGLEAGVAKLGWHAMWMEGALTSRSFARTAKDAIEKATSAALGQVEARFNAASLDSVVVTRYPGFQMAQVTLHARQIQQSAVVPNPLRPSADRRDGPPVSRSTL